MSLRAIALAAAEDRDRLWVLVGFAVLGYSAVFAVGFALLYRIIGQISSDEVQTTVGWILAAALVALGLQLGKPLIEVAASLKAPPTTTKPD